MTAGIVVGIMITPIVTAITREVFATCPAGAEGSHAWPWVPPAGR